MKLYELTFLVVPEFSQKEAESYHQEIKDIITKSGAEVKKDKEPTKQKLAYLVNKKAEGYLSSIDFVAEEKIQEKIDKKIKKEKNILRFLIIKKDERISKEERKSATKEKPNKPGKTKLSEIDAKIDEMI